MRLLWPHRPIRIETPQFTMRTMSRRQVARATFPWTNDQDVMAAINLKAGKWLLRRWRRRFARVDNRRTFCFGIWERKEKRFIGYHVVQLQKKGVALIGIVIGDKTWWGKGAACEARAAIIDYLFETKGVHRIWGTPFARNFPSIYNYQRLNFTYEGVMRRHARSDFADGADVLIFGLLKEEWMACRAASAPRTDE
ncbi:MAG: GNAT family protein [Xanthobacteraceae bacterium]